jgi:hypothetical protein
MAPPDDRLREAIHNAAAQKAGLLRRFAMTIVVRRDSTSNAVIARRDRAIQYAAASQSISNAAEYWITRFRGR